MIIGVPREIMSEEGRVALLPQQVGELRKRGHKVVVERGAGTWSFVEDSAYIEAGAEMAPDARELYGKAEVILKVKEPLFNEKTGEHEISMMREGTVLLTFLHPASPANHEMVRQLRERGITAFSMDAVPRISRSQSMDALSSMSMVAGYKAVLMAANRLPKLVPQVMTVAGATMPASFLIIGTGVVGLQALATAKRLGAVVSCVDIRAAAREAGRSLGAKDAGWDVPREIAEGEGGYARALPPEWLKKEQESLANLVREADAVILGALVPGEPAPVLITADAVDAMRRGSVIVDVGIDQGGNCELTEANKEITLDNRVVISGHKNLPGQLPVHASILYSKNICNFLLNIYKGDSRDIDLKDEINREAIVTHQGKVLHRSTLKEMEKTRAK